jgi:quercetin dioxygenase-like cupin family protein
MIDFAPDVEGPMHRVMALVYGVILEGIFELTLDSGEKKILREGDIIVQRAAAHKWKNITGNGTMPGRMLYMLLDIEDYFLNGNKVEGYMGALAKEHENEGRVPGK